MATLAVTLLLLAALRLPLGFKLAHLSCHDNSKVEIQEFN